MNLDPRRPTVPEMLPLVNLLYSLPGHGAGGCLHIVLDDGNLETEHIEWCLAHARKVGCKLCAVVAWVMLGMSLTQRNKLCAVHDYPYGWPIEKFGLVADPWPTPGEPSADLSR